MHLYIYIYIYISIHIEFQLCFPRESRSNDTPVAMSTQSRFRLPIPCSTERNQDSLDKQLIPALG